MKKVLGSFYFGYDLENIQKVQDYVLVNYIADVDYEMYIERGDDVMNCIDVFTDNMMNDEKLFYFIDLCEEFVEE